MEPWLIAVVSAVGTGLTTWGAMRVELRWLRRDVDQAHRRIDRIEGTLIERGARGLFGDRASDAREHQSVT